MIARRGGPADSRNFNSTLTEPSAVDRAKVGLTVDGKSSRFSVEGAVFSRFGYSNVSGFEDA